MRTLFTSFLLIVFSTVLFSQTNVSGNISSNTTWTKANSPYVLTGDVGIGTGATLTVEPGAIIRSSGQYKISVSNTTAKIVAEGTQSDSIYFEVPQQTGALIQFYNSNTALSSFQYLSVAGQGNVNYENEFISVNEVNSGGVLSLLNSKFFNTALYLKNEGQKIKVENSEFFNTYLWTHAGNTGYILNNNLFVYSNISTFWQDVQGRTDMSETSIDGSTFINSPIYATHTSLTISNTRVFSNDRNLRASPSSGVGHFITTSELLMDNCFIDGFNTLYGFQLSGILREQAESSITNTVFYRCTNQAYFGYDGQNNFHQNDIIDSYPWSIFIQTDYGSEVDATNNYFDGIVDLDSLETRIRHLPDGGSGNRIGGLVDFSNPSATPFNTTEVLAPNFVVSRDHLNGEYQNTVTIRMDNESVSDFASYEVYKIESKSQSELKGLTTTSSNNGVTVDYNTENQYYLRAVESGGDKSMFSFASNERPYISGENYLQEYEAGDQIILRYKVFDPEGDLVKLSHEVNTSGGRISPDSFTFDQIGVSGDTLLYDLSIELSGTETGYLNASIEYTDGLNTSSTGVLFKVVQRPVLESVGIVENHYEGFPFDLNEQELFPIVQFTEQDDEVRMKITEVLNGTLIYKGDTVESLEYISPYPNSEEFFWVAPNQSGIVDAFKIKLYDNDAESEEELVVQFDLLPNSAPVLTKIDTISAVEDELRYLFYNNFDGFIDYVEVADSEEHPIHFVITEVINGRLLKSNAEDAEDLELPVNFASDSRVGQRSMLWLPPANEYGKIPAFKVRATDGGKASDEYEVYFQVQPVNDLPVFDFVPDPPAIVSDGSPRVLTVQGISDGPNEDEELSLGFSISNTDLLPYENVTKAYEPNSNEGSITFTTLPNAVGTTILTLRLSDGVTHYSQEVQITLMPVSAPPEIDVADRVIAYTDYPFNLDYSISDDQGYYTAIGATDSDWIQIDNRNRVQRVTQLLDSYGTTSNGLLSEASADVFFSSVTDKYGNLVFSNEYMVRSLSPDGFISTIAGSSQYGNKDGTGKAALLSNNRVLAYDSNSDLIYISDFNNNLIKTINRNLEVVKFIHMDSLISNTSFVSGGIDGQGNLYVASSGSGPGKIFKISPNGDYDLYAGGNQYGNDEGHKDEIRISVDDMEVTQAGVVYFSVRGLVRKISLDGHISKLNLPDVILAEPRDVFIELEDDGHLLVYQQSTSKLARIDLSDESYELLTGTDRQGFENNILAEQFGYNGDGPYVYALEAIEGKGIFMSVVVDAGFHYFNDYKFIASISPNLDSIQGTASIDNIGEHEVTITAKDFEGNSSTKTVIVEVRENNKIEATNLSQTITFDEDTPLVDLGDIVLSGLPATEQAKVTIEVDVNSRSAFTVDSGNGESFDAQTGTWTIIGSQSEVNAALASLSLIPGADYDEDFEAKVVVVNAVHGVPNEGIIQFKVNPVADLPRLVTSITDSAYVEIPYEFEFELEDPDSYVFNLKVDSYPEWMVLSDQLWAETYSGFFDYNGSNVNGDLKSARFDNPRKLKFDQEGNLYVIQNSFVRKISKDGQVTNFLNGSYGYLDGDLPNAYFDYITDMAFDEQGNIYVADGNNRRIRKIDANGTVTTIAGNGQSGYLDGNALEASFNGLRAIEVSENGEIYILDSYFVRKLDTNGQVTTIAGNGSYGLGEGDALNTPFYSMTDLEIDSDGNLIIADDYSIRKLDLATNQVTRLAGNGNNCCNLGGSISETYFRDLKAIEVVGDIIYAVTDDYFFSLDQSTDQAQMLARYTSGTSDFTNEGELSDVTFNEFGGLAVLGDNIFLSDYRRHVIRRVYFNNTKLSGTPGAEHLGENQVQYTLVDASQQEHLYTSTIDVRANLMPKLSGVNTTYSGVENQAEIDLSQIAVSDVVSDSVHITLKLSNPNAGSFNEDVERGARFDSESGVLEIKSTEVSANEFFSGLSFEPALDFYGSMSVEVGAKSYNTYFTRTERFKIKIARSNTNPELIDLTQISAMVDVPMEFVLPLLDEDQDPLDVKIEGLPDWLQLKMEAIVEVGTEANMQSTYSSSDISEGSIKDQFLYFLGDQGLAYDSNGLLYFTNYTKIQRVKDGNVETIAQKEGSGYYDNLHEVVIVDDEIFTADQSAIYKVNQGELRVIAGGAEQVDKDGKGIEAGFLNIHDFISDENGGFYVADEFKIRHIDSEGNVSTIAGTGSYGDFSEDGNALELPIHSISHFQLSQDGGLIFGLRNQQKICHYKDGLIKILFAAGEYSLSATHYNIDRLGNAFTFGSDYIYVYDTIQGLKEYVNARNLITNQVSDGPENQFQWSNISSVIRKSSNELYLLDRSAGDIRYITYYFKYTLVGTPPEASEGYTELSFKLNDGYGGKVNYSIPLNVQEPDRPEVIGFPQEFSYTEDDEPFALNPISIQSQDADSEFQVEVGLGGERFGSLVSEGFNLSDSLSAGTYLMRGTAPELNQILGMLYFRPGLDNDTDSFIDFEFKELDGVLSSIHQIPLSVAGVNDAPRLYGATDTVAYVGDSLGIVLDIFDLENDELNVSALNKPEWLDFSKVSAFRNFLPLNPDVPQLASQLENNIALLRFPTYTARDSQGNIYIVDKSLHSIFKRDKNGVLTLLAGSLRAGYKDGPALEAQFYSPSDIAVDNDGTIYVADQYNNSIRQISPAGEVVTIAGSGRKETHDGFGKYASFDNPKELALTENGKLYISDGTRIRVLDLQTKLVSTVPINMGQDNAILSMALASNSDILIGTFSQLFRFTSTGSLVRSYGSGSYGVQDGDVSSASFSFIRRVAEDKLGNILMTDQNGNLLRKISPDLKVTTLLDLEAGSEGNLTILDRGVLIANANPGTISKIEFDQFVISGIPADSDVGETSWQIKAVDSEGMESIFDLSVEVRSNDRPEIIGGNKLLLVGEKDGEVAIPRFEILGSEEKSFRVSITQQKETSIELGSFQEDLIAFDTERKQWIIEGTASELNLILDKLKIYSDSFGDEILNLSIKELDGNLSSDYLVQIVSKPVNEAPFYTGPKYVEAVVGEPFEFQFEAVDPDGEPITFQSEGWLNWLKTDSVRMLQSYFRPIYSRNLPDSISSKIIGPTGVAFNSNGEPFIYSSSASQIFKLNDNGEFEVFAGNGTAGFVDGSRLEAQFDRPRNLLYDQDDNLIVSELYNGALRKIDVNGNVSTLIGLERIASPFNFEGQDGYSDTAKPFWIDEMVMDDKGNIYTSEYYSVGKYNAATGYYQTIAGKPGYNFDQVALDGSALDARFLYVNEAIAIKEDSILIFDDYERTIKIVADGMVETISGGTGIGYFDGSIEESKYGGFSATLLLKSGNILVYDDQNYVLRELDFEKDKVVTIAGVGYGGVGYGVADKTTLGIISYLHQLDNGDIYLIGDREIKLLSPSVPKIYGTPAIDDIGEHKFKLRVSDGHGGIITEEITINVLPPNMAPEVTEMPSQEETYALEGQFEVSLFDYFSDAESSDEELTYEVVSIDTESVVTADAISSTDGILSLNIQGVGEANVTVKATDVGGKSVTTTFAVTIAKAEAEITFSAAEGIEEDGQVKEVTVSTSPSGLNYTITYNGNTEAPTVAGTYSVVVTIDEANYSGVAEYELVILPFNAVPEVTEIPLQEETYAPESQFEVSLFNYFSDVETSDEELTYEVISIDSETVVTAEAISSTNGILSLNILGAGEANVTLKATDVRGKSVTTTFAVSIAKAEAEIDLGELEFINDEAEKSVTVTTVPSGLNYTLTYDEESAIPSTVGEYAVKVVIDEANYQGEATGILKVLNIVPEDIQISSLTVLENSASATVIGALSVTDQNSADTHTYELEAGVADNDSFELSGSNLLVKDALDFEQQSSYSITVTVTDNYEASYSKSFSVGITDVNEAPTIDEVEGIEIVQNLGELSLTITGLSAGEEAGQTIELSSSVSGVVESASISLNSDNESATLNFQTIQDQTGAGTIVLAVKDNGGTANGGTDTKTITISVAVLSSNITVSDEGSCGPGSVSLSATGADDYNWYTSPIGGTSFVKGGSTEVNVTETTTYFVAGIFSGTESKLRIPVTASLYSMPDIPTVTNNQGVLTTSEASGITYQWILDGEEVEGATSSSFEPILSGQYSLRATNANGCSVTSESIEVVLAGVEDNYEEISAKIYPVPATDVLELEFEETLQKGTTIKLMSNTGAEFSQTTLQRATRQVSLDVSYLPEGTHIVFVRSRNKLLRKKFIIAR